jgi:hypothetical protein
MAINRFKRWFIRMIIGKRLGEIKKVKRKEGRACGNGIKWDRFGTSI